MEDATLEHIACPARVDRIICACEAMTATCPLTGEADTFRVEIIYRPRERCLETASLGRYLGSYGERRLFCEEIATQIAQDVCEAVRAEVNVVVTRCPSDGIRLRVEAHDGRGLSG